jgi:hypothetical protein
MHDGTKIAAEIAAAVNAGFEQAGRQEARRLRQEEGMSYEAIAKRLGLEPAEVYGAVTGKSAEQVEAWRKRHFPQGVRATPR